MYTCLNCGVPFKGQGGHLNKYCSQECYFAYRKVKATSIPKGVFIKVSDGVYKKYRNSTNSKSLILSSIYDEVSCTVCGKKILRHRSNVKRQTRFCCSSECKKILLSTKDGTIKSKRGSGKGCLMIHCENHPNAHKGFVPLHRIIVEEKLGRYLEKTELVHHIDCDNQNNMFSNFDVLTQSKHSIAHASLNKLVKELLASGTIRYDKEDHIYKLKKKGGKIK
jgi:hypothetical protein